MTFHSLIYFEDICQPVLPMLLYFVFTLQIVPQQPSLTIRAVFKQSVSLLCF